MDDCYYYNNIKHINFYTGNYENENIVRKLYFSVCVKKFDSIQCCYIQAYEKESIQ